MVTLAERLADELWRERGPVRRRRFARSPERISQVELAELANISFATVRNMEQGIVIKPAVGTVGKIARVLGMEPVAFVRVHQTWIAARPITEAEAITYLGDAFHEPSRSTGDGVVGSETDDSGRVEGDA
jgi:transcriptional regulator with XRE-family HTH domain